MSIKLMHVLTDSNIGGAGVWVENFCRSYNKNLFDLAIILPENSLLINRIESLGVRVIKASNISDKSFSLSGVFELFKILKKEKPELLHTHSGLSARISAKLLNIPVISTRHCLEGNASGVKKLMYRLFNNFLSKNFIAVSEYVKNELIESGVKKDRVFTVYNGSFPLKVLSEEEIKNLKKDYGFGEENIIIGICARLEDVKNHKLFIESAKKAYKKCDKLRFLIVGSGSLEDELKKESEPLLSKGIIVFLGRQDDITPFMNVIDINALTSKEEALSLALIEGCSLKKPPVSTNSHGPCEVIGENCGIIVPNFNSDALEEAFLKLSLDKELRLNMGQNAYDYTLEKFSIVKMQETLEKIYYETAGITK